MKHFIGFLSALALTVALVSCHEGTSGMQEKYPNPLKYPENLEIGADQSSAEEKLPPVLDNVHEPRTGLPFYPPSSGYGLGGGGGGSGVPQSNANSHWLLHWNQFAVDTSGVDHAQELYTILATHEQFGPLRAARAMAIVHIAIFEAVNAIEGGYESYIGLSRERNASMQAAIAQAAHDTLIALFPSQSVAIDAELMTDLGSIPQSTAKQKGIELGALAAQKTLELRANDGSNVDEPVLGQDYFTSDDPGRWRRDPISLVNIALGAAWIGVTPFVIESASQFRAPPPPPMDSLEYTLAYNEAKRLGGDGIITPTERTDEQTQIGIYWAYDGTPSLCAPPRLYNQIVTHLASQMGLKFMELARLLALVNVTMADTGLSIWEAKYYYDFWRPVIAIREADFGTGPSGLGDGNPDTVGDVTFTPLGSPATNLNGPNFTPPFPTYPSGHGGFGGAVFQILRKVFGRDDIAFTFVSDEYNGETKDNEGNTRPLIPRSFSSLSEAEEENGQSRIYLGIHWAFDKTEAIIQGRNVADYIYDRIFRPIGN